MHQTSWRTLLPALLIGSTSIAATAQAPPPAAAPAGEASTAAAATNPLQAVGPQAGFGDLLVLGTGGRFEVAPGTGDNVPVIDGAQVTVAELAGPWQPGRHAVSLQSVPPPGEPPAVQPPLHFVYDPGPPMIQWEVGDTRDRKSVV